MKFPGRDAPTDPSQSAAPVALKPPARRRGLLEATEPDGSWGHVGVTFFKTVAMVALAVLCWQFIPSFEDWSFGDSLPGGKLGAVPTALCLGFGMLSVINLYVTIKSAVIAARG